MTFLDNLLAFDIDKIDVHSIDNDQRKPAFRVFKSDSLEFFTHITPQAIVIIWTPIILYALYNAVLRWPAGASPLLFIGLFVFGIILLWTFTEYIVHRFIFHAEVKGGRAINQIVFLFHGIHHYQPHEKTRLVMPPLVSIPMGLLFYGLFVLIGNLLNAQYMVLPLFAGTLLGYVLYDLIHYATHHWPMLQIGPMKFLKRHHMEHHYKYPNAKYGVTNAFWDQVFHTEPV